MEKKENAIKKADKVIYDAIMEEGEYLRNQIEPDVYEEPEGFDLDESFQQMLKAREAWKAQHSGSDHNPENAKPVYAASENRDFIDSDKKYKKAKKPFSTLAKAAMVVLVAGVCLVGFSLQSEATRMWWMESLGWNIGDDSATKVNNDGERDVAEMPEWEAASTIEKELGIKVPKLQYKPDQSEFSDYMYETVTNSAVMYYKMGEEYLTIGMTVGTNDTTSSANFDGCVLLEETMETACGVVSLREIQAEGDAKKTVSAEWNYQDTHYEIFGRISLEEMKKIIENLIL